MNASKETKKNNRIAVMLMAVLSVIVMSVALTPPQQAYADSTSCKTVYLFGKKDQFVQPHMVVPVCYNGSIVWQNGNITPGVDSYGYTLGSISWYGSYNGGNSTIFIGENYTVNAYLGLGTISCASRWSINAHGDVTSFDRGC